MGQTQRFSPHNFVFPTADDHAFANLQLKMKIAGIQFKDHCIYFSNTLFKPECYKFNIYSYSSRSLKEIVTS